MDRTEIVTLCSARVGADAVPELVEQSVDEASEMILNYTNRIQMPLGCKMVWVALASDLYKYYLRDFPRPEEGEGEPGLQNVSHIKIDDAEVEDGITPALITASMSQITKETDFLKDYRARLHPFRKMRWRPVQ